MADPLETCFSTISVMFDHSMSKLTSIINRDLLEEYDSSCPDFQGHSRSLELTRIRHLWLPISDP